MAVFHPACWRCVFGRFVIVSYVFVSLRCVYGIVGWDDYPPVELYFYYFLWSKDVAFLGGVLRATA